MRPKDVVEKWVEAFNTKDTETLANLYTEDAINHQVANSPIEGKAAIRKMFERSLQKQKWFALWKIFLKMATGLF